MCICVSACALFFSPQEILHCGLFCDVAFTHRMETFWKGIAVIREGFELHSNTLTLMLFGSSNTLCTVGFSFIRGTHSMRLIEKQNSEV